MKIKTETFTVELPTPDMYGKSIQVELTLMTYKGVVQNASLKQLKTWEHDKEIVRTE